MPGKKKESIRDKALGASTSRDEKVASEHAEREASREAARRRTAERRAGAAENKAAEAKARAGHLERRQRMAEAADMREKARQEAQERAKGRRRTYIVKPGDSLSKIAKELLGDASRWPEIYELNKDVIGDDPNLIHPNQQFVIPAD